MQQSHTGVDVWIGQNETFALHRQSNTLTTTLSIGEPGARCAVIFFAEHAVDSVPDKLAQLRDAISKHLAENYPSEVVGIGEARERMRSEATEDPEPPQAA